MRAKIIKTTAEQQTKGKASWTKLNVVFRNLDNDKVDGRNIVSFNKIAYDALKNAVRDEVYELTEVKNDKGYDEIVKVVNVTGTSDDSAGAISPAETATAAKLTSANFTAPRSNFETPEERAARQVYIVRQSGLERAIETLTAQKKPVNVEAVTETAEYYKEYVFNGLKKDVKLSVIDAIKSLQDDIPDAE